MTINEKQDSIILELAPLEEWFDKYEYIITLGKKLGGLEEKHKTEENSIAGCQSKVWLHSEFKQGLLHFSADSDTVITRGLIALLLKVCDGQSPADIYNTDLYFLDKIGLSSNLSPSRANGLASIVKRIKDTSKKHL